MGHGFRQDDDEIVLDSRCRRSVLSPRRRRWVTQPRLSPAGVPAKAGIHTPRQVLSKGLVVPALR